MIPNILSIAGSDPSGGAGIQADIKTISANGGYAMAAIAALTVQNTQGVLAVQMIEADFVAQQIAALRADIRIDAVKIGMLGNAAMVHTVFNSLAGLTAPIVLDPVMVAKSGDRLLAVEAVEALRGVLHLATIITPNLPEAADLLEQPEAVSVAEMEAQALALLSLGAQAVLLKGGHLPGGDCFDVLATDQGIQWLHGVRHATLMTHGTGCTLSSAVATQLGHGLPLSEATRIAKVYVAHAISLSDALTVGHSGGHGPTHHFHAFFKGTNI